MRACGYDWFEVMPLAPLTVTKLDALTSGLRLACFRQLQLAVDPATISPDQVPIGDVAELTGIFDHPAARDCEFVSFLVDESRPEPERCRPEFIVTHIE